MAAYGSDGSSSSDGEQQAYCRAKRAAWTEAEEERLVMLAGKLEPGQRLSWRFLAEELGTGRSPKQKSLDTRHTHRIPRPVHGQMFVDCVSAYQHLGPQP
ncbi:hypothetical protein HaLaN_30947 [Haematococcus lacustris]|uniref:Myb-like domain-containing protein n=1 Tax=Haematococcus lacustris TaxID=44745 RepID=A0A6A0AFY7_HAELA|nr:hypothetical protein HaLaN_30947 [Haematococcus lacustris]